ncbi:unnamed protein product [Caenorhabditis angaria]|uniref:Splicing factor cactin central domain-containing protein n=1 Tax=Caenorhabditis angaria TaxID=860376 RepID=A0A9P1MW99_9PELO|nr:unnamed protein product [Caenorhabditis angaria]
MGKSRKRSRSRERKRRHSSSSESSSQDEGDRQLEERLKEERKRKKEQKKLDKERMKQNETAEEKRQRRMEKRKLKEEKRKDTGSTSAIPAELAYTNLNNPFNDTKLTDTFVWGKKLESEGKSNLSMKQIQKETHKRVQKNLHEAAEFKKVRDAKMAAKEDMEMMKRDADLKTYGGGGGGDSKERQFTLDLVKERTRIRIEQGRAKAIDLLTRYSRYNDPTNSEKDAEFELEDPILYIKSNCKTIDDLEDLLEDIKTYRELESNFETDIFWNDIQTIC